MQQLIQLASFDSFALSDQEEQRLAAIIKKCRANNGKLWGYEVEDILHYCCGVGSECFDLLEALGKHGQLYFRMPKRGEEQVSGGKSFTLVQVVHAMLLLEQIGVQVRSDAPLEAALDLINAQHEPGQIISEDELAILWAGKERHGMPNPASLSCAASELPADTEQRIWQSATGYTMRIDIHGGMVFLKGYSPKAARSHRAMINCARKQVEAKQRAAAPASEAEPVF